MTFGRRTSLPKRTKFCRKCRQIKLLGVDFDKYSSGLKWKDYCRACCEKGAIERVRKPRVQVADSRDVVPDLERVFFQWCGVTPPMRMNKL